MNLTGMTLVCFLAASVSAAQNFIAGADFSDLSFFESKGVAYKVNGLTQDGLAILKSNGVTCVRLRLFTSSASRPKPILTITSIIWITLCRWPSG